MTKEQTLTRSSGSRSQRQVERYLARSTGPLTLIYREFLKTRILKIRIFKKLLCQNPKGPTIFFFGKKRPNLANLEGFF